MDFWSKLFTILNVAIYSNISIMGSFQAEDITYSDWYIYLVLRGCYPSSNYTSLNKSLGRTAVDRISRLTAVFLG